MFPVEDGPFQANLCAIKATDAAPGIEPYFNLGFHGFRVLAPRAMERTPLEKHGASYSRPILRRAGFYVHDKRQ
jgi:hypothetical protein